MTRWFGVLLLLCVGGGWSCVGKTKQNRETIVWTKPPRRPLYRGIDTGLSPSETWKQVCRRWSFGGSCAPLAPVEQALYRKIAGKKLYPSDLRLFSYHEKDGAYPCKHFFAFRAWGLDTIRSYCSMNTHQQLASVLSKIRRHLGKPLMKYRKKSARVWVWQNNTKRVMLLLFRGRHTISVYKDLRLAWTRFVSALRPVLAGKEAYDWKVWQSIPVDVRREVLENFSRITDRLGLFIRNNPLRALPTTSWNTSWDPMKCMHRHDDARWRAKVWTSLGFRPHRIPRLQYRWKVSPGSIYSRSFTMMARGCGFRFRLVIDQSGRKIQLQKLRFYPLKVVTMPRKSR